VPTGRGVSVSLSDGRTLDVPMPLSPLSEAPCEKVYYLASKVWCGVWKLEAPARSVRRHCSPPRRASLPR